MQSSAGGFGGIKRPRFLPPFGNTPFSISKNKIEISNENRMINNQINIYERNHTVLVGDPSSHIGYICINRSQTVCKNLVVAITLAINSCKICVSNDDDDNDVFTFDVFKVDVFKIDVFTFGKSLRAEHHHNRTIVAVYIFVNNIRMSNAIIPMHS
ncbi:hypothetical protein DERP_008020 [Dermatophagoides pteronyssinus]|uniref:Uncharacterized protein n=1 Tax=Dermatophagoides pteronyssinus TaxID=6956 RepID=A0ABQ8IT93_DERPT|nr:hypothetical protein DERP_008020 [Dermatophagoides pteronyssinus]